MKNLNFDQFLYSVVKDDRPVLVYNLKKLKQNILEFNILKEKLNLQFLFPIKAFPNNKILKIFMDYGFGFDVANKNELNFVMKIANNDTFISCTGPWFNGIDVNKTKFKHLFLNANSLSQFKEYACNGVRINFNEILKEINFSRFGNEGILTDVNLEQIKMLHFHIDSEEKMKRLPALCKKIKSLLNYYPNIEYLNIGGSWLLNAKALEKVIRCFRKVIPPRIKILVEMGENWFKGVGFLVTKVVDIKKQSKKQIITINAIKDCNAKWSIPYLYNEKPGDIKTIYYGCSCYENDVFTIAKTKGDYKLNDIVILKNINGYSYAWNSIFNGANEMEVLFYE